MVAVHIGKYYAPYCPCRYVDCAEIITLKSSLNHTEICVLLLSKNVNPLSSYFSVTYILCSLNFQRYSDFSVWFWVSYSRSESFQNGNDERLQWVDNVSGMGGWLGYGLEGIFYTFHNDKITNNFLAYLYSSAVLILVSPFIFHLKVLHIIYHLSVFSLYSKTMVYCIHRNKIPWLFMWIYFNKYCIRLNHVNPWQARSNSSKGKACRLMKIGYLA